MDGTFTTLTHVEALPYLTFPGSVLTLNLPSSVLARLLAQAHRQRQGGALEELIQVSGIHSNGPNRVWYATGRLILLEVWVSGIPDRVYSYPHTARR
jgi:hypothetical protein